MNEENIYSPEEVAVSMEYLNNCGAGLFGGKLCENG